MLDWHLPPLLCLVRVALLVFQQFPPSPRYCSYFQHRFFSVVFFRLPTFPQHFLRAPLNDALIAYARVLFKIKTKNTREQKTKKKSKSKTASKQKEEKIIVFFDIRSSRTAVVSRPQHPILRSAPGFTLLRPPLPPRRQPCPAARVPCCWPYTS